MPVSVRVKTAELNRLTLANRRLAGQRILRGDRAAPAEVVRHLLALQAQDLPGAKWSIGLRTPDCTHAEVDAALAAGELVRSWPMRGTLHLVAAEDLGWMLALTTPRMLQSTATRSRQLELDSATFERARDVATAALSGGRSLGRDGLMREFEAHGIRTTGQRGYHLIWRLAQTGTLCWGPPLGNQQALVLLDEWVRAPRVLERDEALREFVLRYFTGHGPATVKDFLWWSRLTMAEAKLGLALAADELTALEVEGTGYWIPAAAADVSACDAASTADARAIRTVYALPGFDEYLLGYQDRSAVLSPEHAERIVPGGNGMFLRTILVGGRVAGTWRTARPAASARTPNPSLTVEAVPFRPLTAATTKGFGAAARRYGRFLGVPTEVRQPQA